MVWIPLWSVWAPCHGLSPPIHTQLPHKCANNRNSRNSKDLALCKSSAQNPKTSLYYQLYSTQIQNIAHISQPLWRKLTAFQLKLAETEVWFLHKNHDRETINFNDNMDRTCEPPWLWLIHWKECQKYTVLWWLIRNVAIVPILEDNYLEYVIGKKYKQNSFLTEPVSGGYMEGSCWSCFLQFHIAFLFLDISLH